MYISQILIEHYSFTAGHSFQPVRPALQPSKTNAMPALSITGYYFRLNFLPTLPANICQ